MSTRAKIVGAVLAVLVLAVGFVAGSQISRPSIPGEDSAEVGFSRDMSDHHAQAVEMGMIAFQKATLPEIRTLGGDIAITQQGQIGMMQAWLQECGYGPSSSAAPMAWMPEGQRALNG